MHWKFHFTRPGAAALLFAGALMVAGATSGVNYLVLVASALIGTLAVSCVFSVSALRALDAAIDIPSAAVRNEPFVASLRVINRSGRVFPGGKAVLHVGPSDRPLRIGIPAVPAGEIRNIYEFHSLPARGCFMAGALELKTSLPFGLLVATRAVASPARITVYPRTLHVRLDWNRNAFRESFTGIDAVANRGKGQGGLFHGLRGYLPGDPLRFIHWPKTAHRGELMSKEYEQPASSFLARIVLENRADRYPDAPSVFEASVDAAAGLLKHLIDNQIPVSLLDTGGGRLDYVPGTDLTTNVTMGMHFLATVGQAPASTSGPHPDAGRDVTEVCFLVGPHSAVPSSVPACRACRHLFTVPTGREREFPVITHNGTQIGKVGKHAADA